LGNWPINLPIARSLEGWGYSYKARFRGLYYYGISGLINNFVDNFFKTKSHYLAEGGVIPIQKHLSL